MLDTTTLYHRKAEFTVELVRRPSSGALGSLAGAGNGSDVSQLQFSQPALSIDDLPSDFATGRSMVLGSSGGGGGGTGGGTQTQRERPTSFVAKTMPKPLRTEQGIVQRRIGWQVHPNKITKDVVDRPLRKAGNAYTPAGAWALSRRTTWESGAVTSAGNAPVDAVSTSSGSSASASADPYASEAVRYPDGAEAMSYLPAAVRRSIYARVPDPLDFDGKIVQYAETRALEVVVIRCGATTSIAVTATLEEDSKHWKTSMTVFTNPRVNRQAAP